ncbi:uncharacterized protein BDR25DRAFT_312649 [Lindgomyces ingoldianus]|uniref:Uncharacterized protein n=1 Tax=Lindgomyces ingoldianus TaxID=673940 RepID=A0ACB6R1S7_9PLEO|nr:uncharacterized protein BDR25DRAFT_312649 [Lindgomyces ingoldianus]KAF2472735.1 hypothetical protein BDR25DRAFT_312649 [Lindgomyces ingoldianus]
MAPPPKFTTAGNCGFDGVISVRQLTHPDRLFNLEVTFDDYHPHMHNLRKQTSPQHFRYLQAEFVRVLEGPPSVEQKYTKFLLSGPASEGPFMLDAIFYENYYLYITKVLAPGGEGLSLIEVFCMFDAGGS